MSTTELIAGFLEVIAFGCTVTIVAVTVARYPQLPERVPVHYCMNGRVNSWGPRGFVFLVPALAVVFFVAATFFNPIFGFVLIDKHGIVLHPLIPMPCGVLSMVLVLLTAVQIAMLESARTGSGLNMRIVLPAVIAVLSFVVGSALSVALPLGR
jgi:uncharacterized protein DUF1648